MIFSRQRFALKVSDLSIKITMIKLRNTVFKVVIISFVALCNSILAVGNNGERTPQESIEFHYNKLVEAYDGNDIEKRIASMLDELFDIDKLASQVLHNEWAEIDRHSREEFVKALKTSILLKILSEIDQYNAGIPALRFDAVAVKQKSATLDFSIFGSKTKELTAYMLRYPDSTWKVTNVKYGRKSLLREYYGFCKKNLDNYSIAYLISKLRDQDYVVLEDFEGGEVGKLPVGWTWRKRDNDKKKPYSIRQEANNKFLAAEDNGESVILGKDVKWNLREYPYISFRWRARKLPEGGDERYGKSVDSAAGIYIIFRKKLGLLPETVKYVWSTTLPVGSYMRRSGVARPWMVVAESGEEHLGEWRTYVFNVYEAYEKTFGGKPPDRPIGIGILSDANSTHSQAYADYDDIRALKHADADSGVRTFMKAE